MAGFEPAHDGIKTRCLTTWRHPNCLLVIYLSLARQNQTTVMAIFYFANTASSLFSKAIKTQHPLPVILATPRWFSVEV